jgi:hypothetical protein
MKEDIKTKTMIALTTGVIIAAAVIHVLSRRADRPVYDMRYVWYVDYDAKTGNALMVRGEKVDEIKGDINNLIDALNGHDEDPESPRTPGDQGPYGPPRIKLRNIEGRTVHVEIINDEYLTQRMGTSGAQDYLAAVAYTLTEHPGISRVNFLFEEGDHAAPGLYTRTDFEQYYQVIPTHRQ